MVKIKGWEKLKKVPKGVIVAYKHEDKSKTVYAYVSEVFTSKETQKRFGQLYNVTVEQVKPSYLFIWGSLNCPTVEEAVNKLINWIKRHPDVEIVY